MNSALNQTINRAHRRGILASVIELGGRGFALGAGTAIAVLVVSRFSGLEVPAWLYPLLVAGGIFAAAARAMLALPGRFDVALHLDRALRLRDRLASAYALNEPSPQPAAGATSPRFDHEFAAMVRQDGEQLAARIDVRSLAPLRLGPEWLVGAALSVLLFLGFLYVPAAARGDDDGHLEPAAAAQRQQAEEEREQLLADVESAREDLLANEDIAQTPGAAEELEALDRLAQQLAQGGDDPDEVRRARDEAAARLNELADQLSEQTRRDAEAAQRLTEKFSGIEPPENTPMSAQEFDEALRRGEFGAAAQAMQDQLERANELSPQEREELARHLRETAERAQELAEEDDAELAERVAQMQQLLRDYGLDENFMREALEGDEQAQREAMERLEELFDDPESADRLNRDLDRLKEQRELQEQVKRDLEQVNEAMREAADELDPAGAEDREPDAANDDQADQDQGEQGRQDVQDQPQDEGAGAQPDDGQRDPDSPQQQENREGEQESSDDAGSSPDDQETGESPEQGSGDQENDGREQQMPQPGEGQEGEQQGEEGEPGGQAQEQEQRSPADAMRDIERRREQAARRQDAAERARQRAREFMDSPRQRGEQQPIQRELDRQLSPGSGDGADPGDEAADPSTGEPQQRSGAETEDVDARIPDDDPGRVIAEWFDEENIETDPEARRVQREQRVREARRIAERAVEDAAVPARYHDFIRRYFRRFGEPE